ncbi:transaldolase family protein [Isoptericola sp. b490]|uniref:transaldolase family protein n=1 Tax=Actinotalea lenta TaxID=3064654 RepID=UPI002713A2E5|nr:transaldolase family protein [Isoptericola sp. b490]MDO8119766.1 transaldolase family protein [Isoptericola sp. b490]
MWNDSANPVELATAIDWGAVGATCNPVIALAVLKADQALWAERVRAYVASNPTATESEIGWAMVRRLSTEAAELLRPAFDAGDGRDGRLSIQVDPRLHTDRDALVEQAVEFHSLAPNMIVKIPATKVGIEAIEEATFRGVSINATVSFTVPQTIAVAEAVERGLTRREAVGLDTSSMGPVCTIMVGRLDDWLKIVAKRDGVVLDPGMLEWAGVAVFKEAYRIYQERGYRLRLLSAAFRNHMHWSALIGGDVIISPPFAWGRLLNASDIDPVPSIETPVPDRIHETLYSHLPDYRAAFDAGGIAPEDFLDFGATRRTLRGFIAACADLETWVRDIVLADPS